MVVWAMERRSDIDRAKGLAILLVVFGHLVARAGPEHVGWYEPLRHAVYSFHMAFFFYLSGLVVMLSGAALQPRPGWVKRRAMRLLLPFAVLGILVAVGKHLAVHWMFVDHAPGGLAAGVSRLIWHTGDSPDGSIWYLFVLFAFSVAAPWALAGQANRLGWGVLAAVGIFFIPLPDYFYADDMARYAVFFTAGLCAGFWDARWLSFIDRSWPVWLAMLVFMSLYVALSGGIAPKFLFLAAGLCAIPALHGLVRYSWLRSSQSLLWLGRYCFMIYLFITIFIGLAKALLFTVVDWDGAHFLPFAMCLMLAGVFGPVGLKYMVLRHMPRWDRMTD